MRDIIDLDLYPLDQYGGDAYAALIGRCSDDLARDGMFSLPGFLKPNAAGKAVAEVCPALQSRSFEHRRAHNIYFRKEIPGLASDHPALRLCETVNHTICADQIPDSVVMQVYRFPPLLRFLAEAMGKERLHVMDDPLACANVMAYRDGEALNWHFDRSEFTTTLLLQAPDEGGDFEYRTGLCSDDDPNYEGVARLLAGEDPEMRTLRLEAGTLNVFRGKNTAHRVTPVKGVRDRVIAVFSYYESPDVMFSEEERIGFYGRAS